MESLDIKGFLTVHEASVSVRPFTVLIGPQASGKSVIAKVLYFFRSFLSSDFIQSIDKQQTKRQLDQAALVRFEQIFPRYAWSDQEFELVYKTDALEVTLHRRARSGASSAPKFNYSANLSKLRKKAKAEYERELEESKTAEVFEFQVFEEVLRRVIYDAPFGESFKRPVFIPASRSFFANLQKNVFSFLANSIPIDPLIKEFGSVYESNKRRFNPLVKLPRVRSEKLRAVGEAIQQEANSILAGEYLYEDDQDWIVSGKRRINLSNASSGQQEAAPLLVVLSGMARLERRSFFIEEPEAHLFPVSQRKLIGIFSRLYHSFDHRFLLTTHSPYVLTAMNNLILASNLVEEEGSDVENRVKKILGGDEMIRFDDVSAYTIEDGVLTSIVNRDTRLIGSSIIDSVSDEFDSVMDKLMEVALSKVS